jgi:ankyrin repeat protein
MSSDYDILRSYTKELKVMNRISIYDENSNKLITAIKNKKYNDAMILVKTRQVDVDGHNRSENTPLTDAANRGDVQGVKFLLEKLGANPYSSCDCPHHKTAFHYASEGGHIEVLKVLQKYGNMNVLDNRKYTPLDVAKDNETRNFLLSIGTSKGSEIKQNQLLMLSPPSKR